MLTTHLNEDRLSNVQFDNNNNSNSCSRIIVSCEYWIISQPDCDDKQYFTIFYLQVPDKYYWLIDFSLG